MKLNIPRLTKSLEKCGYNKIRENMLDGSIYYATGDAYDGMYDWLHIHFSGKHLECVSAWSAISVIAKGALTKGLCETKVISRLGMDCGSHRCFIANDEQSLSWEQRLADGLEGDLAQLRLRASKDLLARTETARTAADKYWKKTPPGLIDWYADNAEEARKIEARGIAEGPICSLNEHRGLYEIAIYLILSHSSETDGKLLAFTSFLPFNDIDLEVRGRVELLVDKMLQSEGDFLRRS